MDQQTYTDQTSGEFLWPKTRPKTRNNRGFGLSYPETNSKTPENCGFGRLLSILNTFLLGLWRPNFQAFLLLGLLVHWKQHRGPTFFESFGLWWLRHRGPHFFDEYFTQTVNFLTIFFWPSKSQMEKPTNQEKPSTNHLQLSLMCRKLFLVETTSVTGFERFNGQIWINSRSCLRGSTQFSLTHRIHGTNGIFTYMKTIKINQM